MAKEDGQEQSTPVEVPTAGPLVVTPDAPDDGGSDEGEGVEEQAASGERPVARQAGQGRNGRAESRKERGKLFIENQRLKEQVASLTPRLEQMQKDFQAQIQAIQQGSQQRQAPQGQQGDPYAQAITEIDRDMAREMKLMRQWDEQRDGAFDPTRYNQLQARKFQVIAQQALAQERARNQQSERQRAQQSQQGQTDPQQQHRFNVLADEFPWIADNENPMPRMAVGHEYRRLLREGRPDSLALHREAAATVAARFGMAGPRSASRPSRGVPSDGMRGDGFSQPQEVQIPPEMLQGLGLPMNKIQEAIFGKGGRNGT